MKKIVIFIVVLVLLFGFAWMQATAIPENANEDNIADMFGSQARILDFLKKKSSGLAGGDLHLEPNEFNSAVKVALAFNTDGQKLLQVSERINTIYHQDAIEVGAVINLAQIRQVDAKLHASIQDFMSRFPFLAKSQLYLAVKAKPIAQDGKIVLHDDIGVKIGKLPIPAIILKLANVDVSQIQRQPLSIKRLHINEVAVNPEHLSVKAAFR